MDATEYRSLINGKLGIVRVIYCAIYFYLTNKLIDKQHKKVGRTKFVKIHISKLIGHK